MKIRSDFMLREIAGTWLVVPIGSRAVDFNNMLTLSDTGAFLWKQIEEEKSTQDLISSLLDSYDVDEQTAISDIGDFIKQLNESEILEQTP